MASTDGELEKQLKEFGKQLLHPPNSVDALLSVLDRLEKCLSKVDQSPKKSMLDALRPSMKALIKDNLAKHSDVDVKVAVAACISEITRITAPDAPYDDDVMRDVFQLIVSSFEGLDDQSSPSYNRRASILETVSKVRSCVIMLDLECDGLIVEMFEHFLKSVRDYHLEPIFSSMENIMVLVLEESEDIPVEMLKPLLASVKKDQTGVLPVARKLGEGVLLKSADKLKPYLKTAITSLSESLDMYTKVVTSVCEGATDSLENNDENTSGLQPANESKSEKADVDGTQQADESKLTTASSDHTEQMVKGDACPQDEVGPTLGRSPKRVMSNGVKVAGNEDASVDQESKKPEEDMSQLDLNKDDADDSGTDKRAKTKSQTDTTSRKVGTKADTAVNSAEPSDSSHVEGDKEIEKDNDEKESGNAKDNDLKESENEKDDDVKHLENKKKQVPQEDETASPSNDGVPPDETVLKNAGRTKNKRLTREDTPKAQPGKGKKTVVAKDIELPDTINKAGDGEAASGSDAKPSKKSKSKLKSTKQKGKMSKQSDGKKSKQTGKKADIEVEDSDSYDKPLKTSVKKGEKSKNTVEEEEESELENKPVKSSVKKGAKSKNVVEEEAESDPENKPLKSSVKKGEKRKNTVEEESESDPENKPPPKPSVKKGDKSKSKNTVEEEAGSDSENKPLKPSAKKSSSSKKKENGKKRGNGKTVTEKDEAKSLSGDDEEDSSPKSTKVASSAKRKHTATKDIVEYDDSLVGTKVKVWWPEDKMFYEGIVAEYYPAKKKHKISYVDGDEETLNMRTQRWEILQEFSQDQTADPAPSESQEKTKDSSKRVGGSKSKKENSGAKAATKKTSAKPSDAAAAASKEAGKSKEDGETPKASTKKKTVNKSTGKTLSSGSKSNTNGSAKAKSGPKESDDMETPESEKGKGKSTETAKGGSKSAKKRKKRS